MFLYTIAFLAGDVYLQFFSHLPNALYVYTILFVSVLLSIVFTRYRYYLNIMTAFVLGFSYSYWYASSTLAWSLPAYLEGKPLLISGYIASIPVTDDWQTNFIVDLETRQYDSELVKQKAKIHLAWRGEVPPLMVGDKWQWVVRLKRMHSTQNPAGYDYEAWALQHGIRAKGYVISSNQNQLIASHTAHHLINQWRQKLNEKLQHYLPDSPTSPWLTALILGERHQIAPADWEVLRATGTNHLMAIAGLHIGILAGFVHFLFSFLWRRSERLMLWCPTSIAASVAALVAAIFYSLLAGFSLPTQRAAIMLSVFVILLVCRRQINAWHAWSMALLVILLLNPLSVLSESFWLSFGTIALIIYGMGGRLAPRGWWWKWGRTQWIIGVGLIPFSLLFFQEMSLISFIANTVAIPWLGFFILPFCFLSTLFLFLIPNFASILLGIADKSLGGLWMFLTFLSHLPHATWHHAIPNVWIFVSAFIGILLLLLPSGVRGRLLGVLWLLPLLLVKAPVPASGGVWLTMLDVGQGLSLVVETQSHVLVYDAGASNPRGLDMGESVVLPYLRFIGTERIDKLVLSHGDNDHMGGAKSLLNHFPVLGIETSTPDKIKPFYANYCLSGETWEWDHVRFRFLYPEKKAPYLGNDSSCVLQIDNGEQSILLTGDIEKLAEKNLLETDSERLRATILTAPHHGSRTSGLLAFIRAVEPRYVLYSTGYRNRYHFPHPSIIKRYNEADSIGLNTAKTGAIQFKIEKYNPVLLPDLFRVTHHRYWMD